MQSVEGRPRVDGKRILMEEVVCKMEIELSDQGAEQLPRSIGADFYSCQTSEIPTAGARVKQRQIQRAADTEDYLSLG